MHAYVHACMHVCMLVKLKVGGHSGWTLHPINHLALFPGRNEQLTSVTVISVPLTIITLYMHISLQPHTAFCCSKFEDDSHEHVSTPIIRKKQHNKSPVWLHFDWKAIAVIVSEQNRPIYRACSRSIFAKRRHGDHVLGVTVLSQHGWAHIWRVSLVFASKECQLDFYQENWITTQIWMRTYVVFQLYCTNQQVFLYSQVPPTNFPLLAVEKSREGLKSFITWVSDVRDRKGLTEHGTLRQNTSRVKFIRQLSYLASGAIVLHTKCWPCSWLNKTLNSF